MDNYLIRPAITTKTLLEHCQHNHFVMPDDFGHILQLDDFSFTNQHLPARVLKTIEQHTENKYFYADMESEILQRWVSTFNRVNSPANSSAEQLVTFYRNLALEIGNLQWQLDENDDKVYLSATRGKGSRHSIYEDLILKTFIEELLKQNYIEMITDFKIHMPYSKEEYEKIISTESVAEFNTDNLLVIVDKSENEKNTSVIPKLANSNIDIVDVITAAANIIPPKDLNTESLAFVLGVSTRTLQRRIKPMGLSLKHVIQQVKFERAKYHLTHNQGNLKRTAYDCGFIHPSRLTKLFLSQCNLTPSQFVEQNFLKNRHGKQV